MARQRSEHDGDVHPNPFVPGFGVTPPVLVGRDELLGQVARAFGSGYDPHRTTWLSGPRGCGKTVLLNAIQRLALQARWRVVQEDASAGPGTLIERIVRHLHHRDEGLRVSAASITTPVAGASLELVDRAAPVREPVLREVIGDVLGRRGVRGLLVTLDEVHTADRGQLARVGNEVQHLLRAGRPVAVVLAGLPQSPDELPTFLTRCRHAPIDRLTDSAVRLGLLRTAEHGGRRFDPDVLDLAVHVAAGYPYMLQLIGYWAWQHADPATNRITSVALHAALARCEHELTQSVLPYLSRRLSPVERQFLEAVAAEDGPASLTAIATRLRRSTKYASVYRHRLIAAGVITAVGHGTVDFTIPGHRALLRLGAATARPIGLPTAASV